MRILTTLLMTAAVVLSVVAAERAVEAWPPKVTLPDALQLAENCARTNKIDTSQQYLASVRLQGDKNGDAYWEASWMHTNRMVRGGFFLVRVHMDRSVTLIGGK